MTAPSTPQRAGHKLTESGWAGDDRLAWYLIRTATRREDDAEAGLIEAGHVVYLPRHVRKERRGRGGLARFEKIVRPLFDGYLFVGLPRIDGERGASDESLASVLVVERVHAFVRFTPAAAPCAVPWSNIRAILSQELAGTYDETRKVKRRPVKDEPVSIVDGPFAGFAANIMQFDAKGRVSVLIHLFGRPTQAEVGMDQISWAGRDAGGVAA